MSFLLDHETFQKNLNYVLMCVKTINDNRVYNEMHIKIDDKKDKTNYS